MPLPLLKAGEQVGLCHHPTFGQSKCSSVTICSYFDVKNVIFHNFLDSLRSPTLINQYFLNFANLKLYINFLYNSSIQCNCLTIYTYRYQYINCLPTCILWTALFSWVPNSVDWTKMIHSLGSKFVAIIFSCIILSENYHFVGTGIRGTDPPRKPPKIGTPRNLSHPQYVILKSGHYQIMHIDMYNISAIYPLVASALVYAIIWSV